MGGASRDGLRWRNRFDLSGSIVGELCKVGEVDPEVTEGFKDIGQVGLCTIG